MADTLELQMSDMVDDDVKTLFAAMLAFIQKYGYTNATASGFVNPNGVTLSIAASKPDGGTYRYEQFVPNAPAPSGARHPAEVA